ncbi:MAG: ankyrin repeat domain-containing protein [Elusimicrobiaceae bacterium]|nr:ankyrin repeat domain-containing protein [Elusimicrobiaceae bacterium]
MRKLLLGSFILLALSACNKESADIAEKPSNYDLKSAINELPTESKTNTIDTSYDKEPKDPVLERLNKAFSFAIVTGDEEKAAELLKQGANPNQEVEGSAYRPALCRAVNEHSENIVKLLLQAGANVNENCSCGTTPLILASLSGSPLAIVNGLIEAGADVNKTDDKGDTALYYSAGSPEITKALLSAGADVKQGGREAFLEASHLGIGENVQQLLNAGINVSQEDKDEALRLACPEANIEVVEVLLAAGANVNAKDKNGKTALMYTTPYGYYEENLSKKVMEKLIAARADVNAANKNGKTVLMYITNTFNDYTSVVTKLLKAGSDINATDNKGRTVLLDFIGKLEERKETLSDEAQMFGDENYPNIKEFIDYLQTLIKAGANVNAKDNNGSTALIYATKAKSGNYEGIVSVLLKAGADVNAKDNDGKTAIKLAQEAGNTKIVELLKAAGAKE